MRRTALPTFALALVLCGACAAAADPARDPGVRPIADFAGSLDGWEYYGGYEFPGASGRLQRDANAGPKGAPCAKLTGDFAAGGSYVAMTKAVDAPCAGVSIQLRAVGCRRVSIRLTDSSGQIFQQEVRIKASDDWQVVAVDDPVGAGSSWGGAKDKVWHPPARKVAIMNCGPRREGALSLLYVAQVVLRAPGAKP